MVTFCASGFPECDELAPQLDRVASLATMGGLKTRLAGVDMYADSSLAIRFALTMHGPWHNAWTLTFRFAFQIEPMRFRFAFHNEPMR